MALLDQIREKNPSLRDRSDDEIKSVLRQSPEFQYFDDAEFEAFVSGDPGRDNPDETPGFLGGLAAGIDQMQAMGGGLAMAAGEAAESEGLLNYGRDVYQRNMEEAAENDLGYGFTDIRGVGDAWSWARYTAGNLLPMMAGSVAGGGIGGLAAGTGARMLAGAAAREGAKRAGQALGAAAASTGMETGALMGETEDLDVSLAHGTLAGSLDALVPIKILRSAGKSELADRAASEISEGVLADLRRQAGRTTGQAARSGSLTGLMAESTTEGLQGLIGQHANYWVENNGESLLANLDEVDVKAMIDEAAAGGLMGGMAGAPTGIAERGQARRQADQIEAAREQAAAQGGDALDQTMAAQSAEQQAEAERPAPEPRDPAISAEVGNRLQLAMGELDDLQNLARGSSYQGQTRLRNISTILDRAERAFEEGNVEQAGRLTQRAEGIAANLRTALERTGSDERPIRAEGELVGDEAGQGAAGRIGQDGRRLPPGDPNTIFAEGPTADQTQYDPQARNVRRDEAMAAQRQGEQRLREQTRQERPRLTDEGMIYGDGPIAGNANTGLDQPFERARFTDTQGSMADRRAQQQESMARAAELARTRGQSETAYLPDNTPITTRFRVMDMAKLQASNAADGRVNPAYPQELQPRDRSNANSQVQVRNIAARLNPERLGSSRDAGTGAPIIGPDGVVESGNGRTMALDQAYRQGGPQAQAYRDYVRRQAEAQGMDPAAVDAMERPVLVRERTTSIDRADFARRANESQVAGMTAYEQAQADADSLTAEELQAWAPGQSGDPLAASNRGFQRAFVARLGNNEAARYTGRDGQASPELGQRMQRAVFAKAYQDADMVEMATEQGDQMRNLTAALQVAAPDLAIARETGSREAVEAIGTINDAVRIVRQARQDGISVRELTRQGDAFSEPVPETTALLAVAMHNNLRSRRALSEGLRYIGQAVRTRAENERNGALFEDTTTNEDVFNAAFQEDSAQRAEQRPPEGDVQPGAERGQRQPTEGRQAETAAGTEAGQQADPLRGDPLDSEWTAFSEDSGTRGVPRAEMPQIKAEHRGALANFLSARGIDSTEAAVPALSLRPTQREFSEERVQSAKEREGGDRAILVSADGHVVDGHHQWLAKADEGGDVRVIRLGAPIDQVLEAAHEFPSSEIDNDAPLLATYDEQELADRDQAQQQAEQAEADQRRQEEQRAQADAEVDDFNLSGSDRTADVMAAGGQQDLMGAQPPRNDAANTPPEGAEESANDRQQRDADDLASATAFGTRPLSAGETAFVTRMLEMDEVRQGPRREILERAREAGLLTDDNRLDVRGLSADQRRDLSRGMRNLPDEQARYAGLADEIQAALRNAEAEQRRGQMRAVDDDAEGSQNADESPVESSAGSAEESPAKPKRRNKPLSYTGYSGEERQARSYQELGDYRIAKVNDNLYEVIDSEGRAVSQMAGASGADREAQRLNDLPSDQRFAMAKSDARPVHKDDIAAALEGIEELGDAVAIQSARELPEPALLGMAIRGINPRDVRGMYLGGDLYVIADNVDSVQEGVRTAVHEAVGHKGMRGVLGAELEPVMLSLYRNLPNSKAGREALREVRRDYPFLDPAKREDRITIAEEMVAHLLEKGHRPRAWQRAVAKIRELLRRLFPSVAWTYTDALALGEQSREWLRKRQAEQQGDSEQLYSLRAKRRVAFEQAFDDFTDADRAAALKIGQPTMFRSAWQWWREKTDRWQAKVRQGVVDQYGPLMEQDLALYGDEALTEQITQSAWVKARMSKSANGVAEVLLKDSRIEWNEKEQVFQPKDDDSMGLGAVLGQLGDSAEIHRFLGWIAGNRADKLRAEGRENLFDDGDIDSMKDWDRGTLEDGRSRREVYDRVFGEFQQYRDDVLAAGEALGVISPEQRAAWRDEFYVPFYRLSEEKGFEAGQLATSGLSRQQAVKKLKGGTGNLNNLLENTMLNFHHIIDAGLKNNAARQAIDNSQQLGIARQVPESGRITATSTFVMEDGKKVFYQVDDPLVYNAITALGHNGMNSSLMKVLRGFKRIFTNTVTVTPQYIIANLMRDSIQAPATSDISKNVLGNILVGSETLRDKKMKARMLAAGANFSFGHLYGTGNADEVRAGMTRSLRDAGAARSPGSALTLGAGQVASAVRQGWAHWNDFNNHFENVNRAAIYRQGATEGNQLRAAFEARDLMDFSSHGAWPATRVLIDIIPFLNARIQGLDKIYRSGVRPGGSVIIDALRGKTPNASDKQLAGRFWAVTGAVSLAMLALYLENRDEEWYKELEEWEKDTYTHFNIGNHVQRIPNPFEVGAIGTMMVRTAEQFLDDEATGELFAQRMLHMLTETFAVGMPQAMQPALDVYSNRDSFTDRPIENMGMQNLSPELRKRYNTTAVATGISSVLNSTVGAIGNPETNPLALSPVQIDHLVGGYLGQVGAWGAGMADTIWRKANGHEAPARRWYEFQPLRRFYRNLGDTDAYTKYGTVFYDGLTETRRAYSDVKELRELGHWEEAKERFEETRNLQALRKGLNRAQRLLSKYNKQIEMIQRSDMSGELKRQRIDRIGEKKRIIQRTWGERIQQARTIGRQGQ